MATNAPIEFKTGTERLTELETGSIFSPIITQMNKKETEIEKEL
jgi:hypothetical protein